ncbi:hypothetical protein MTO96_012922 [Rhipicephalus appendiculatus]
MGKNVLSFRDRGDPSCFIVARSSAHPYAKEEAVATKETSVVVSTTESETMPPGDELQGRPGVCLADNRNALSSGAKYTRMRTSCAAWTPRTAVTDAKRSLPEQTTTAYTRTKTTQTHRLRLGLEANVAPPLPPSLGAENKKSASSCRHRARRD